MADTPTLTFDRSTDASGPSLLKVQVPTIEINIFLSVADLESLRDLREASWDDRRSIRAGSVAGSPVFWCCSGEEVTLLVGSDDEAWDLAFSFNGLSLTLSALGIE